jgi:DNA-binding response OmpR family regulator
MNGMSKILVVDDENDFVELVSFNLKHRGHEVLTALSGLEALKQARRFLPDTIVMDVMMPGIDGFSVCEILRNQPVTKAIPVIMYTALTGQIARMNGIQAGADDYLIKPFKMQELVARVEKALERRKSKTLESPPVPNSQSPR